MADTNIQSIPPDLQASTVPRTDYRLTGLTCADCAAQFEKKVKRIEGVVDAKVNFGAAKLVIYGEKVSPELLNRIGAAERIQIEEDDVRSSNTPLWKTRTVQLTAISGLSVAFAYLTSTAVFGLLPSLRVAEHISIALYILAMLTGGWQTGRQGLANLVRLRFDMSTLMTVAVGGAVAIGYWEEAAVVSFLFGVSETLEEYSLEKARQSLRHLLELAPKHATIVRDGKERHLSVDDIRLGDLMIVRPGEKIAMDGVIVQGASSVNQAAITGESVPIDKQVGDEVFAGTINNEGTLDVRVTKLAQDTTLAKIIFQVEEAQAQKAPAQAFVDRFAKYYTPAVMLIALLIAVLPPLVWHADWRHWLYEGLALLIVACPCALVVATPVAIVTGIGNAARNGVLIKGGVHLENLSSVRVVAFDKTGTLTTGSPHVTDVDWIDSGSGSGQKPVEASEDRSVSRKRLLAILYGVERRSEHPLAHAIRRWLDDRDIESVEVQQFRALPGQGTEATYDGEKYYVGNERLFRSLGVDLSSVEERLRNRMSEGKTTVLFGNSQRIFALLSLADQPRTNVARHVQRLKYEGVQRTVMLTGDNEWAAGSVASAAQIDDYLADLLPQDKLEAIRQLEQQYGRVAMVGDGVNDAPALAAATVGVAMGGAGTDTAMESADIVLMADDLEKLPYAVRLSNKAMGIIKQNIAFALGLKLIAVLFVFPGWLTLWLAIVADMGATILVVLNSLRLMRVATR